MITVRRLDESDWRSLRDVRLRALADAPGSFFRALADDQARPDTHWRDMLTDAGIALFGAFDGEAIVGLTGAFTDRDDPSGRTAALGMTWLAPPYRGRGVSRLYYAERIAWARARGFARIAVGHRASNTASGAAMRQAGFQLIGREPHHWPDGADEDLVQYELLLGGA